MMQVGIINIKKAMQDPRYAFHILFSKILKTYLKHKVFAHTEECRSDSDNGNYVLAVSKALKNQNSFDNFKRSYSYRVILEHVSKEQGAKYLKILESRNDQVLALGLDSVLKTDTIGNPLKYKYPNYKPLLSPTTLRYLKVTSDLQILFGSDLGRVAEIGCGYGGQTLVNDQILSVTLAKLFDLAIVNKLIERYLDAHLLKGTYKTTVINQEEPDHYDLVISNYGFSELPRKVQLTYIKKVISKARRGYLTMNSGLGNSRSSGKLNLEELRRLLPTFELIEEDPHIVDQNYIVIWGHSTKELEKNFKKFTPKDQYKY